MLEIKNANKYFNKHKKNQVHAINNTSITLEDTGLVALLGPSGCGKTTLLNTIGGLDKLNKGSIYINGKKISSRFTHKVDKIRNTEVGYIFQDYKLVEDLTVYDNVAMVLKILGIKDKKEINTRVEYVLNKVGMLRYKKRPVSMLSGGERQRVGIARAIVKDPTIILADEPTGNLDSKNSLEIMKIIRAISKEKLVILVTHEQELAKFYATRIIEINDGKVISDYKNEHSNELDYKLDNTFYLKDFDNQEKISLKNNQINIYSNKKDKVKLDIVVTKGNIYIKSNNQDKIEVVDDTSNIEFINDNYKKIEKKDIEKYKFDFDSIINKNIKKRYNSILNPVSLIINGFKKVFNYTFLKKMLLIGFFLSGMFVMYSVSSLMATFNIKDEDFVTTNKEYLTIEQKKIKVEDYLSYESQEDIEYILPGNSIVGFNLAYNDYYQTSKETDTLSGSIASIELLKNNDIILGKFPENDNEIVVDKLTINRMFDNNNLSKMSGILSIEDILNREVSLNNMNNLKIVGITNKLSPSIYTNKSLFINIIKNTNKQLDETIQDYTLYQDKIELKKGNYPTNDYEVIVNISNQETMKLNKEINLTINNKKLKVVGYYDSKNNYNNYLVNNNTIKYYLITNIENITIKPKNKNITISNFQTKKLNIKDSYEKSKNDYLKQKKEETKNSILVSSVILIISLVEIFLMVRSSFLSRVKEVGIYRAIGVKKIDIYKLFFGEIFAITTIASIPGIAFMAYILKTLSSIKYLSSIYIINKLGVSITIIFIYIFNQVIGLIPIYNTIRKRPAQILSRYDLD